MSFENFKKVVTQVLQLTYNGGINFGDGTSQVTGVVNYFSPMVSGGYYRPLVGAASGVAAGSNTVYAFPLTVVTATTLSEIGVTTSTVTTAGTVRLGIYSNVDSKPDSLIADYGTVAYSASSTAYTISITETLQAGKYWLAAASQSGSSTWLGTSATVSGYASPTQRMTTNTLPAFATGWLQGSVTGALPSTGASMILSNAGMIPFVKVA